jgi:hypothetical protein
MQEAVDAAASSLLAMTAKYQQRICCQLPARDEMNPDYAL